MSRLNPIVFPITQEIRDTYDSDADSSLFSVDQLNLVGNYLVLWIFSEDYTATLREKDVRRGAEKTFVFPPSEPYQFEANVKDGRRAAIDILRELEGDTVTLLDFHVPDGTNPYTIREGVISIESGGSFFSEQYNHLTQGFRVIFEEV